MDITAPNKLPKVRRRRVYYASRLHLRCKHDVFVAVAARQAHIVKARRSRGLRSARQIRAPLRHRTHANDGNLIAKYRERRIYVPFKAIPTA